MLFKSLTSSFGGHGGQMNGWLMKKRKLKWLLKYYKKRRLLNDYKLLK